MCLDKLRRTGATDLTDGELILFDIIATTGGTHRFFDPQVFPLQYNYPSHELDEQTLAVTLNRFESLGWTHGEDFVDQWSQTDRSIRITALGAQLWESERKPDWSRYVMDSSRSSIANTQRHRIAVLGHSPSVCREFFEAACDCGFFDFDGGPVVTASAPRNLFYWREQQPVYLVSAWLHTWDSPTDWACFETRRTWWRFPDEIGSLWGLPSAT